jgi:hypothetical protein
MMQRAPSLLTVGVIGLLGFINLARGSLHLFLADSGAGDIAGLDLSAGRAIIVSFLAAIGVGQLAMAMIDFTSVLRFRAFVRPLLLVHTLEAMGGVFVLFYWKPLPIAVPGQWGALVAFIVLSFVSVYEFSRGAGNAKA